MTDTARPQRHALGRLVAAVLVALAAGESGGAVWAAALCAAAHTDELETGAPEAVKKAVVNRRASVPPGTFREIVRAPIPAALSDASTRPPDDARSPLPGQFGFFPLRC